MRGDSLRDLYAKTLALLGLGLLAGVGALVDYWPVGVGTPQIASLGFAVPEPLMAGPAADIQIPVRFAEPARAARPTVLATLVVTDRIEQPVGRPLEIAEPTRALPEPAPASAIAIPVAELALAEPALPPGPDFDPAVIYQLGGNESEESGLLADAVDMMKSTGSTIARGGVITGSSLVGALRVVSGAFKKLKFF